MAWVFVTGTGFEGISIKKTDKIHGIWHIYGVSITIPKGSIKKLIGRELTFDDEPVILV